MVIAFIISQSMRVLAARLTELSGGDQRDQWMRVVSSEENRKTKKLSSFLTTTTATARQSVMPVPFMCVTRATKVTINVTQWPHESTFWVSRVDPRVPDSSCPGPEGLPLIPRTGPTTPLKTLCTSYPLIYIYIYIYIYIHVCARTRPRRSARPSAACPPRTTSCSSSC